MFESSAEVCGETVARRTGKGAPVFPTGNSSALEVRAFTFISTFSRKRPESVARASAPRRESCAEAAGAMDAAAAAQRVIAMKMRRMRVLPKGGTILLGRLDLLLQRRDLAL